jgi:hypothetical protein
MKQPGAGEATNDMPRQQQPDEAAATAVSGGGKRLEEGYDSAATVSADETTDQDRSAAANRAAAAAAAAARPAAAAGGPPVSQQQQQQQQQMQQPVQRTIFVKDLMKTVIEQSLQPPANGGGCSLAGRIGSSEIPNLKNMLQVAGPAPQHGNFVRGALASAAAEAAKDERASMEAAARAASSLHLGQPPAAALALLPTTSSGGGNAAMMASSLLSSSHPVPPPNDDGVLNLTTTRRERSPPAPPAPPLNHHRPHVPPPPAASGPPYAAHISAAVVDNPYAPRPTPFVDYQTAAAQQRAAANKEPPMAHGSTLAKTTHKETMYMDVPPKMLQGVYGDHRVHSPNLMMPRQDPRKDLQSHPKQQQQQRHHPQVHGGAGGGSTIGGPSKVMEGSITRGQPIPPLGPSAAQQQQNATMGRYDKPPLNPVSQKGSLTTGTPIYTDHRRGNSGGYPPVGLAAAANAVDPHKKAAMTTTTAASPYPTYHQRPPSGGLSDPSAAAAAARGSSSRSVIENDYKIAQSLPRKVDTNEEQLLRGVGYPRGLADAHHMRAAAAAAAANVGREVQIVDARAGDPRFAAALAAQQQQHHDAQSQRGGAMLYGAPRVPNPFAAREPIRGDPRADIPPRDGSSSRGSGMVDSRPEYRTAVDPRDGRLLDSRSGGGSVGLPPPRGQSPATYSPYDNRNAGMPGSMSRDSAGRRSSPPPPARSLPSAASGGNRMLGGLTNQQLASPRPGSITSGLPRASVEIYNTGGPSVRQAPDVSITKQPAAAVSGGGGRLEYPLHAHHSSSSNLSSLADIALQQPKMLEDPRGGATLTVTRADGLARQQQQQQQLHPSDLARLGGKYDERSAAAAAVLARAAEDQQRLVARLSQMNSEECMKLFEQAKRAGVSSLGGGGVGGASDPSGLTAATLIDMIVTNQINQGSEALRNAFSNAAVAAAAASGSRHSPHAGGPDSGGGKDSPGKQQQQLPRSSPSLRQIAEEGGGQQHVRTSPAMGMMGAPPPAASLGDHIESMIAKEVQQNRTTASSPYAANMAAVDAANEHWKRRQYAAADAGGYAAAGLARPPSQGGMPRPPSVGMSSAAASSSQPQLVADERQIIRVAQNASPHSSGDKPPSRSSMMLEPISPPTNNSAAPPSAESPRGGGGGPPYFYPADPMARFLAAQRKPSPHEMSPDQAAAAAVMAAAAAAKNNPGVFDYVKHKIAEVMKNDKPGGSGGGGGGNSSPGGGGSESGHNNKPPTPVSSSSSASNAVMMMGPPHTSSKRPLETGADSRRSPAGGGGSMESGSGGSNMESPRKRYKMEESAAAAANDMPDSPGSPEMVIDESAGRPDSAHSHKTASPAPGHGGSDHPSASYAYNRGGGGQKLPPHSSPQQHRLPQQQQPVAAAGGGQLGTGYDPLSDDD